MPIYEYRCTKCGHQFENLTNACCAPNPQCPRCQSETEKLMSTFAAAVGGTEAFSDGGSSCSSGGCGCSSGSCGL